jgi:DNA-binding response OmpR family regulator
MAAPRVLLVEDEPEVRRILCDELVNAGYTVDCVGTKAEAEVHLARHDYRGAVLDVRLPDGAAFDLVDGLAARGAAALLITGHPEAMAAMERCGRPYLAKPFRIGVLVDALERTIGAPLPSTC